MATSSGNSSGSGSGSGPGRVGSEEDLKSLMDQRKRRRMQSNRDSARRSRMRKQKHVDDLTAQIDRLRNENNHIMTSVSITTTQVLSVEGENGVLRAQMMELSHRLDSLNEILGYINNNNNNIARNDVVYQSYNDELLVNYSWNLMGMMNQQPIMANDDMYRF